jgi:hypothetical protein
MFFEKFCIQLLFKFPIIIFKFITKPFHEVKLHLSETSFFKFCAIMPIPFRSEFHVMNPARLYGKKAPKKGREKETRC